MIKKRQTRELFLAPQGRLAGLPSGFLHLLDHVVGHADAGDRPNERHHHHHVTTTAAAVAALHGRLIRWPGRAVSPERIADDCSTARAIAFSKLTCGAATAAAGPGR